jgi:hypothetical protein
VDEQRQVWCAAYDSDTPNMDGTPTVIRMAEQSSEVVARGHLALMQARSEQAPKRNLRVETRFVTDWKTA